eukprot:10183637-Lingulodinium_polyedra.AAC.1
MMRSNRSFATHVVHKSHARALHANSCSHGVHARAVCEPLWRPQFVAWNDCVSDGQHEWHA